LKLVIGDEFDPLANSPPMHGLQGEHLENQHVQGASDHVGLLFAHGGFLPLGGGPALPLSPENLYLEKLEMYMGYDVSAEEKVSRGWLVGLHGGDARVLARPMERPRPGSHFWQGKRETPIFSTATEEAGTLTLGDPSCESPT
jgi:hypothetical protein